MSGLEIPLLIAGALGSGTSAVGTIMGGAAQASANNREAGLKIQQANELDSRELVNEGLIRQKSLELQSDYQNAGGGLGGVLRYKKQTEENIANARREADFKSYMLRQGADIESQLSSDALTASYLSGAGSILGFGTKVWGAYGKFGNNKELGKSPVVGDG